MVIVGAEIPPVPEGRPPSVHEPNEYQRHDLHHFEIENDMIPTTVTELYDANRASRDYGQIIQDLYRIVHKLSDENRKLKLSVNEQQEIIESEYKCDGQKLDNFFEVTENKQKDGNNEGGGGTSSGGGKTETKSKLSLGFKNKDKSKKQQPQPETRVQQQPVQNEIHNEVLHQAEIAEEDRINSPTEERMVDLTQRLEASEEESARLSDTLEQMSAQKSALERDIAALQSENEHLRGNNESLNQEKWELSAASADLQNRLQAVSFMQGVPDTMLQEEVRKLHVALNEERKVTEKLSRNLELEKRRSESLEQKAKSAFRRSGASSSSHGAIIPEEIRSRDEQVMEKMERFQDHLDRMTQSLHECEQKLTGFEIQEEYHAADLRKELAHLKKILGEEKRKSHGDCGKLLELQTLFGSAIKSYNDTIEHIKHLEHKSKKNNDEAMMQQDRNLRDNNSPSKVESLQSRLTQAQDDIRDERRRADQFSEKLRQCQKELESLPILQTQVEVYQMDFNAEREAREKIAGEKADLLDELQRLKNGVRQEQPVLVQPEQQPVQAAARHHHHNQLPEIATGSVRDAVNQFHFQPHQRDDPPPLARQQPKDDRKNFSCPKCNKAFPILTLLQNHVNACLDRD